VDPQAKLAEQALREILSILKDAQKPETRGVRSYQHRAWAAKIVARDALERLCKEPPREPVDDLLPPAHPRHVSAKNMSWGKRIA